jgi:tRNA(Ile)-lysidine synthase TilS/MesJ
VAVSGGPDSLALCALLRQLYPKEKLFAFFVHHNMDARGVTEDPAVIETTLKSLGSN